MFRVVLFLLQIWKLHISKVNFYFEFLINLIVQFFLPVEITSETALTMRVYFNVVSFLTDSFHYGPSIIICGLLICGEYAGRGYLYAGYEIKKVDIL